MASRPQNIFKGRPSFSLQSYINIHLHTFFYSLGRLAQKPFNLMMTIGVIGITLSLPAGMLVAVDNFKSASGNIDLNHNISLYLKQDVTKEDAERLASSLQQNTKIQRVLFIDKQQALEEFKQYSGFGAALSTLGENPLPHVIQITPNEEYLTSSAVETLRNELEQHEATRNVQIDMAWLERLNAILNIVERSLSVIIILLGIAVLLIISNTIRLELQNRRDEIDVTRLVGATRAFIRRPFIYSGFWYGVFGGVLACVLVTLAIWLIDGPTSVLSKLYGSSFQISYMPVLSILYWLIFAILLGVIGSWVVVSRYLSELES